MGKKVSIREGGGSKFSSTRAGGKRDRGRRNDGREGEGGKSYSNCAGWLRERGRRNSIREDGGLKILSTRVGGKNLDNGEYGDHETTYKTFLHRLLPCSTIQRRSSSSHKAENRDTSGSDSIRAPYGTLRRVLGGPRFHLRPSSITVVAATAVWIRTSRAHVHFRWPERSCQPTRVISRTSS